MTTNEIIAAARDFAEHKGIEIEIPAVLDFIAAIDLDYTFSLYGESEVAEEFINRYIHAEAQEVATG